jgi:[ribosomal protein S5]-alanine N-acetyltransferase
MVMIRTERLLLRPARWDDLPAMHAILSDRRAMRYWSSLPHETIAETRVWLRAMIEAPHAESFDLIIERDGDVIGKTGCYRVPEIGYILRPDQWGRGYAREALAAVIPAVFERFPIPAIRADVDPRNTASIRLLEGLGFAETGRASGTWTLGEEVCDSIYYALARPAP